MPVTLSRKIGIIADVHANVTALRAVLGHPKMMETDLRYCLGDIVGYGPHPNECIALLRSQQFHCLRGNHDQAAIDQKFASEFPFGGTTRAALIWTIDALTDNNKQYLSALPLTLTQSLANGEADFVHGSLVRPLENYLTGGNLLEAAATFRLMRGNLCFVGHTHVPRVFEAPEKFIDIETFSVVGNLLINLRPGYKYIINPGSVGQPRDWNPRASFAVYDEAVGAVEIFRVNYDITKTQADILNADLPFDLAERLSAGL